MPREPRRRDLLKGIGAASALGLAGCIGGGDGGDGSDGGDGNGGGDGSDGGDGNGGGDGSDGGDGNGGGGSGGPDVLNVIGYPQSGLQLFRDYYSISDGEEDIIVPDGLRSDDLPKQVGNPMENVTGTAPGAAGPNRQAFTDMFNDQYGEDPGVFTPHTYDSVAVQILANAAAGENNGPAVRDQMRRVANEGGMEVGPGNLPEGVAAAARGEEVMYQGASSPVDFDQRGDPAAATYNVWQFTDDGTENVDSIAFTGNPGGPMADSAPGGTGRTVKVGILLPETGDLGSLGGPMINAATLAAEQVHNSDTAPVSVDYQVEDTQTNRQASLSGANALVNAGYPSVCGTASSGNNIPTSKEVFIPNEVVGCSPSSTALTVSFLEDNDFIFRTAPSDLLQGQVMAQVAAERLGASDTATLYVNNDYGQQLSQQYSDTFKEDHSGNVLRQVAFNKGQGSYSSVVRKALGN